jgi:FkbM family methyltransferase
LGEIVKRLIKNLLKSVNLLGIARLAAYRLVGYNAVNIQHRRKVLRFYSQFIRKGNLVFDIGANVGQETEIFIELGAKVICVEPQKACLQRLYELFGNNKKVIIVAKGISDIEGFAELYTSENSIISTMSSKWKNGGRFAKDNKWMETEKIATTTLDYLVNQYGLPAFCKIDVEGFEKKVLSGLTGQIPFISFEFCREFFDDAKDCINRLLSIGKYRFNCSVGESMELLSPAWLAPDRLYAILGSLDDRLLWGDIYAKL